ncbi:bifunctional 3-(3-hydroxy-phenyl)propionate/3-hydroxycinnamic acid hydroxylase [Mycolicibacterium goodii]|uniref:3-(3-hydroxyphenyl)propionate hydroxylase n=1 Tax=Mycolicibacterium goodii TaxID=134601 RepID=A0A0K0X2D7_MYCGD|nr:3-(3-hydroxyphenyl)propionate hydroxylase [Mycolicibacterium goodii]
MTVDVAIIGFGPVGKVLAIQLGRRGHTVIVADRNEAGYPLPRAVTHCSDFARILQSIGLSPDTIPHITEPYDDMYRWRNSDDDTLLDVDWSGRGESGWYNTYFFHQPALEDALDALVESLDNVRVMRGWEATALRQREDCATVDLQSNSTDASLAIEAGWVIGADGANSKVRQWAALDWHNDGYYFDWLVVDVKPSRASEFPHIAVQNCDHRRPATMVPGGPGRRRWEFMRLPHESREELSKAAKAWELLAPYGIDPGNAHLERHAVYTFGACWANQWRNGRVMIAGDAAHLMPPFAGQGLGAGMRDAMNLSWKLDAVLRGCADATLLDTYGSERLHHAMAFVKFSTSLGQVICITDEHEAAARDERMIADWRAGMTPPAPPRPGLGAGLHVGDAGGMLARQGRVRIGSAAPALFDDALDGPGAVITRSAATLAQIPSEACAHLANLGIAMVALAGRPCAGTVVVDDVDRTYHTWLDELRADTIVIRPDFHLYGAGPADQTGDLVAGMLTRIGGQSVRSARPV